MSNDILAVAGGSVEEICFLLGTDLVRGLSLAEAQARLERFGRNEVAADRSPSALTLALRAIGNPLVVLLVILGVVSELTGEQSSATLIFGMVLLGVGLRFLQEERAHTAAKKLKELVSITATVVRDGEVREVPLAEVVPGDIVKLAAGDMIPADLRLLAAKDLFLNQSTLTGESLPIEKRAEPLASVEGLNVTELRNICCQGSDVESGSATGVVVRTGEATYFGSIAKAIEQEREVTSFDRGIASYTWLMVRLIAILVPMVFVLNGVTKHSWTEAFLFALAVAVGLTPEMLPMIVTVNLSQGALAMARKKNIVKHLPAIQNLGAIDVLCTDKTGTITEGRIVLQRHVDLRGEESERVLEYGYINSYFQTGLRNIMDEAVLEHGRLEEDLKVKTEFRKIDEIPFDFTRRRMSVIVEDTHGRHTLICKGAVEEVMRGCTHAELGGERVELTAGHLRECQEVVRGLGEQGFRTIAIAWKELIGEGNEPRYAPADEAQMVLLGYLAFLDPPKKSAAEALNRLGQLAIQVKILTGDNDTVTGAICQQVGIAHDQIVTGPVLAQMGAAEFEACVERAQVFARLVPAQKREVIAALQRRGHRVGFLGDGINDAPALRAADIGISVSGAVDIAQESSDVIMLENDLLVLEQGVLEGRRVFGNIIKYIRMAASSNFGNMLSVVGASVWLPFLPMMPLQILAINLLYDLSQTAIPSDTVDEPWLRKPRPWAVGDLLRFILVMGAVSSVFDYVTFFVMLHVFGGAENPALFRTGWFVESLASQTLIIHILRTEGMPFIQSRASLLLTVISGVVVAFGIWLTVSPYTGVLGFVSLPDAYWPILGVLLVCYAVCAQVVKGWVVHFAPHLAPTMARRPPGRPGGSPA